ncbi:GntR family transcriptional regulator [Rhizobium lusitanum]|uniref:GntR family transcriptional regulator n=1 Tax=Rhizobium lusitanum TaxID=293958 RepID=UPI001574E37C|nr:GntR family transcriptional regulator [Rhizobium lusitanum]NTJ11566.1 GntR family transcriptional regulator [Rhizobium lusitanum]
MENAVIDQVDERPRYMQIQKALEERITAGTYPVGTLIPTELELTQEFTASRSTVREALRQLSTRGYVDRKQGVGTRVVSSSTRSNYQQAFTSLEELFQVSKQTYFVVLSTEVVSLSPEIASQIDGSAGYDEWILVSGVRWTEEGGRPICYVQSYIPKQFLPQITELTEYQGPFFSFLERHAGTPIEEVVQEIRAVQMPADFARHLGLRPGSWSLQLLRRYITEKNVLIASFNWHPADQMAYVMQIHRARDIGNEH